MREFEALILGFVQGLTEFLPISSSAHLIIFRDIIPLLFKAKWDFILFLQKNLKLAKIFDVAIHLGTLFSLLFYFRDDLKKVLRNKKLVICCIISTLPALIFGAIFHQIIVEKLSSSFSIAFLLIIFALFLFIADILKKREKDLHHLGYKEASWIGLAQSLALMPGVSRSGVTMTMALFLGYKRKVSAYYSFLISIPVIAAASFYEGFLLLKIGLCREMVLPFLIGILSSFLSGFLAIKFLLGYLTKGNFNIFVIYRILLGLVIIFLV